MLFDLPDFTPAHMNSVNVRAEYHGDDLMPEIDLALTVDLTNDVLDKFDSALKVLLYRKGSPVQGDMLPVSDLPCLRLPKLGAPLKWQDEFTGYTAHIDYGLGGDSVIEIAQAKVGKISIEPLEGGTVKLALRISSTGVLTEEVLGKLGMLVQQDVSLRLFGPEASPL